jgi:CPA1 family monovalent cation:H+ antiporter
LQLRQVLNGINDYSASELIIYGLGISLVVILVRFLFAYPATYIPRLISKRFRHQPVDARDVIVFGWAGMRGVVSMAAALALPLTLADGSPFPHRNLILYITFCVILSTLVLLGLTLPWVIRRMKVPPFSVAAEEYAVRTRLMTDMISHIEENLSLMPDELLHNIKSKYEVKYNRLQKTELPANYFGNGKLLNGNIFNEYTQLQIDLINVERASLRHMHIGGESSEAVVRKIEHELDLEETRLKMEIYN